MQQEIENVLNIFSNSILSIYTQKHFSEKLYEVEINNLNEIQKVTFSQNLFYDDILNNGARTYLTHNEFEKEEIKYELFKSYNRQLQWCLVNAYESFQKYIDGIYAILGYIDNSSWIAKDLGDITLSEIADKTICNLDWFISKVKNKNNKRTISTENQIKQIRKYVNIFKHCEIKDRDNFFRNYYFNFVLISELRHIIVHNDGLTKDKKHLKERILNKVKDLDNNFKKHRLNYDKNIDAFFGGEELIDTIFLTKLETHDRFTIIIDDLLTYSKFICDILISDLKEKQLIK
jgi:hypothetical protein